MPDLSALSSVTTAAQSLSGLVLVTPGSLQGYQPQKPPTTNGGTDLTPQPAPLLFTYEGEQSVSLQSDITDHYVEDNTAVADNIALRPEEITVHGFIGELNDSPPYGLQTLAAAADKLQAIDSYTPGLSAAALIVYQEAFLAYQTIASVANSAISAWTSLAGSATGSAQNVVGSNGIVAGTVQNDQQSMFQQLYQYWRSKTLFTVQTPWAVFQNMAIKSLRPVQDADTQLITDFEITFKMVRFAQSAKTSLLSNAVGDVSGRLGAQSSDPVDNGSSSPADGPSLGSGLSSMGVA